MIPKKRKTLQKPFLETGKAMQKLTITFMAVSAITLSCYGPAHADSQYPSREEWLEVYLTSKIRENTDAWEQRTAIRTVIDSSRRQIIITLTSANGQSEYT